MAITNIITDGTDTVNMAAASNGFTDKYTYRQQIVQKNELGDYPPVTETWEVNWGADDNAERGEVHAKLMRLQRKAQRYAAGDRRDGPVYWYLLTEGEASIYRFALIHDIEIPELNPYFYGPAERYKEAKITVTREGVWRERNPLTGGWLEEVVGSSTVYDYVVSTNKNWVTLEWMVDKGSGPEINISGDADALLRINMYPGTYTYQADNQVTIAKRTAASISELDGFNPHFNPVNLTDTNASLSGEYDLPADANVPGGYKLEITNGSGAEEEWYFVWSYDPDYYQGEYLMIVPIKMIGASDECWLTPIHDNVTFGAERLEIGPEVYVPDGNNSVHQKIHLGQISLPYPGFRPPEETFPTSFRIGFKIRIPAGAGCYIRNWWLVPADEGVQEIRNVGNTNGGFAMQGLVVDGNIRTAYAKVVTYLIASPVEAGGRFLTADHQRFTRLYFFKSYWDTTLEIDAIYDALTNMTVTVDVISRVKALVTSAL